MILNHGTNPAKAVSLSEASVGGSYSVESVSGPEQQRHRLSELGLVSGANVAVVACSRQGMLVVKVGDSRLALSRGMTDNVWVQKSITG